jgi:mannosyltransferase OCH1-like enzyme
MSTPNKITPIKIPRNIFQTWSSKNISIEFKSLTETWINNNQNYSYFLYDDNDCITFIKKNFDIDENFSVFETFLA